ncbi:unnamed protein product [Didymodactylos carnosus]|uniref:NAD(P)(+)--arginine ADP-ribosyltransferase n=1 Tax=Didymodactylos carnosus TaxID=1234261 RepID=A0A814N4U6_9BILA|nr:unnamed protein product [Didymodactylos carnosus]CAF3852917.1 unnamed protein product [Didymodactylos carnosus]
MAPGKRSFIRTLLIHFNISHNQLRRNASTRRIMIEKAAEGLIVEGKNVGKQREGEWMAEQLLSVKEGAAEEVWKMSAHLYSLDSYLYRKLNELMRLVGDEEHARYVQSKMYTLGPFTLLLERLMQRNKKAMTVYRSAELSDDLIEQFRQSSGSHEKRLFSAFTSTSRSKNVAEFYGGNVIFAIKIFKNGADISQYSAFPQEEEVLLEASFWFVIQSCTFDKTTNKWFIRLKCAP